MVLEDKTKTAVNSYICNDDVHDSFGHKITLCFVYYLHVGVHQVPDSLYLPF